MCVSLCLYVPMCVSLCLHVPMCVSLCLHVPMCVCLCLYVVAGCITVTGLASKLINAVVNISSMVPIPALSLFIALFLTMLCCIVLGSMSPVKRNEVSP